MSKDKDTVTFDSTGGPSKPPQISIPVDRLQNWALDLSQKDPHPRWEIEKILTDNGYPIRAQR